ncbi:MAG TPA: phosphate ABC transporter substrate-binding protein [Ktedonobacterales bacterium]
MLESNLLRSLGTKLAIGVALFASLSVAACGNTSTAGTSGTTTPSSLTACTATVQDITQAANGNASGPAGVTLTGSLKIDGSSALQPLFAQAAKEFVTTGVTPQVSAGGSGTGLSDVDKGNVDIGMSDLFQADKGISDLTDHQVAVVAFTLVVSNDLKGKVGNLTTDQIKKIYTGAYTNWSQLGGPNELITVVNRPTTSGTRGTFETYVLGGKIESGGTTLTQDNTGAVFQAVNSGQGAIGYVSTGFVTTSDAANAPVPICIDGYKASANDINAGTYHFWNVEHAYTKGSAAGNAKAFLQYVESSAFQTHDLATLNFYQTSSISPSAVTAHLAAGGESSAPAPESFYQ